MNRVLPVIAAMVLPSVVQAGSPAASASQADCEAGWTLGLEAMALRPFQSEGGYNEDNYDFAGRASLGYQFNDGLFTKVSYFGYSEEVFEEGEIGFEEQLHLKASYLDAVVGQNFKPCDGFKLSPTAGLRWATFEEGYDEFFEGSLEDSEDNDFSGLGIVVGVDATRCVGNGISLYGTAKQSVVFGSSDNSELGESSFSDDRVVSISELGLGVQYCLSGIAANVRAGVEGQYWSGLGSDDSEGTGLAGFVLGANVRF